MKQKALPPLNWLRTFEVSARCLNFTRAAHELCMTQGAVSQQIRLLENHLGVTLFKRLPRGLALTEAGESYFPVVQDAVSRLAVGTHEIFSSKEQRPVKIRGSLAFFTYWLAPRLGEFKACHPHVDICYTSNIWVKDLSEDDDMEIRWGHGDWPDLTSIRLTWDTLFPVCSAALMIKKPLNTVSDLVNHTLLHVIGYEEGWGYWLNMVGETAVDSATGMQFDTLVSTLRMAELGQGIALARSSIVQDLLDEGKLIVPFDKKIAASESFYLVCRSKEHFSLNAQIFLNWLIEQAQR